MKSYSPGVFLLFALGRHIDILKGSFRLYLLEGIADTRHDLGDEKLSEPHTPALAPLISKPRGVEKDPPILLNVLPTLKLITHPAVPGPHDPRTAPPTSHTCLVQHQHSLLWVIDRRHHVVHPRAQAGSFNTPNHLIPSQCTDSFPLHFWNPLHTTAEPSSDWAGLTFIIVDGDALDGFIVGSSDFLQNLDGLPTKTRPMATTLAMLDERYLARVE